MNGEGEVEIAGIAKIETAIGTICQRGEVPLGGTRIRL